jgi:hypothetical protein
LALPTLLVAFENCAWSSISQVVRQLESLQ